MRYIYAFLILSTYTTFSELNAQSVDTANVPVWIDMMQDPNANFFETQKAFEKYWDNRERQPGDGWKVFKRWEWFWQERVNADGSFPEQDATAKAYEQWRIQYNQQNTQGADNITGNWIEVGPIIKPQNGTGQPNGNGRVNGIGFDPTDTNVMWVGAPSGGLWKTVNGGQSWSSNTDMFPTLGVSSILIAPNIDTMYIGTGDRDAGDAPGLGVYKSIDGGVSWFSSNSGMGNRTVGAMQMHPNNSSYILAATSGGVYRSVNSGSNWTLEQSGNFKDIRFQPGNPNVVYASSDGDFYRSSDAGNSWTQITSGLPGNPQRSVIGVTPADPDVVYLLVSINSEFEGLYRSDDAGLNFTQQSSTPNILGWSEDGSGSGGQGWYDLCIAVDPNDEDVVYCGGVNIWKSDDAGVTWDCVAHWVGSSTAASVHADHHWLEYSPYTGKLFSCNDGGVHYTEDDGQTWPEISDGLAIAQIYRIGVSQQQDSFVINGYQDNGTALWDNGIFRTERGGDGMECIIDPSNDQVIFATVYYGNIARSTNGGLGFGSFAANGTNGITEGGGWVTPFILDYSDPTTMFIGYKNVWRTTNTLAGTPTFDQISNNLGGVNNNNIRQIRQSRANTDRLYVIRSNNTVFRSDNIHASNPTWFNLTSNLPGSGTVRDIEAHPTLANTVWLIRGNVVYRSDNGGASWYSINTGLPSITKNCIVNDPLSHEGIYVGTDAGIYYLDSTLTTWAAFDDSLPANVEVTELEIYHPQGNWSASKIRAATYGRGLWESSLYDPENIAPIAFSEPSQTTVELCFPDTITLYNNSAYGATGAIWNITPNNGFSYVGGTNSNSWQPKLVFTQSGTYDVQLIASNSFGTDTLNMTAAIQVINGDTIPWFDDFENDSECSGGCELNCSIINWYNYENGVDDDIDFRINSGTTPSGGTGPSTDFDPGTSTGLYAYTEASFCFDRSAIMESPCYFIPQCTNPEFEFAYHMNGAAMGHLILEAYSNGSWIELDSIGGNQGNDWIVDSVSISQFIGQNVKFRFRAKTGPNFTSDIAIDAVNITAGPKALFEASDTNVCVNSAIQLSDQSTMNPTSWSWTISPNTFSFVNGTTFQSQNPQIQFLAPGTYNVVMQASNNNGNDFEVKNSYINVYELNPSLSTNSGSNTFCEGDTVQLTGPAGFNLYSFSLNGSSLGNSTSNELSLQSWEANDEITVTVTDSNGCQGISSPLLLQVFDEPDPTLISSDEDFIICKGDTVLITVQEPFVNYDFYLNNSLQQSGTSNEWMVSPPISNDEIWVYVEDSNGCDGNSDTLIFQVEPVPPTPILTLSNGQLLTDSNGSQYTWSFNDSVSISNNNQYPSQGDGEYKVRIFVDYCWSDWSDPLVITGFGEFMNQSVKLYPSPTTGLISIELTDIQQTEGRIKLTDLSGRTVIQQQKIQFSGGKAQLDLSNLANGYYQLTLSIGTEQVSLPVMKEN